ncbi:MAG: HAMP domain-containing sensor histidine kinase [Bacteroidetes bacterium]|nr:HAMP domain-containing sensor histidine kinase [Bacteroidota bacterium]
MKSPEQTVSMKKDTVTRIAKDHITEPSFDDTLIAMTLHDVRSPLFYLSRITQSVCETAGDHLPAELREQLADLHHSVKQVSGYVQYLFEWIHASGDTNTLQVNTVRMEDLLRNVQQNYSWLAAERSNTIQHDCLPELYIRTRTGLLEILLRNLMDNAIKHTNSGAITVKAWKEGETLFVRVSDTGDGMSTVKKEQLLKGVFNSNTPGMGFRYIKEILRMLNGSLQIDSEPGQGTSITIQLPDMKAADEVVLPNRLSRA